MTADVSVVVLTYDCVSTVLATLELARGLSDDVHVVDSHSTDGTWEVVSTTPGVIATQHRFDNYSAQRNWASSHLPLRYEWELHLDADEQMTPHLVQEIRSVLSHPVPPQVDGFLVPRSIRFMGTELLHGGLYPTYHLRLFRRGRAVCEDRAYDQHFICKGETRQLEHRMIDDNAMPLQEWVARHNRWAVAEAREADLRRRGPRDAGYQYPNRIARKRRDRSAYYRLPLFWRAWLLFLWRYVFLGGFRDGTAGFLYHFMQGLWYRLLVDAHIHDDRARRSSLPP